MEGLSNKKRVRDDSDESELDSPEVKRLRDDLLGNLDDSDLGTTSPDLDSFMKSLKKRSPPRRRPVPVPDPTAVSGGSQPELGFLLEASDDELGLPPSTTPSASDGGINEVTCSAWLSTESSAELTELWRFGDGIPNYDSFDLGIAGDEESYNVGGHGEYVALDGLFDHSDTGYGGYDGSSVPFGGRKLCRRSRFHSSGDKFR
ncbi:hypothetical protein NMG60_11018980 [Bertholletia excelsa]